MEIRAIRVHKEMTVKRQRNAREGNGIRKSGNWAKKRQRGSPNRKRGSELWGSCATARVRYIRPPGSGFLRKGQNLPMSRLLSH